MATLRPSRLVFGSLDVDPDAAWMPRILCSLTLLSEPTAGDKSRSKHTAASVASDRSSMRVLLVFLEPAGRPRLIFSRSPSPASLSSFLPSCELPLCQRCSDQRVLVDASLGLAPSWLRSRLGGSSGRVLTPAENRLIATFYHHLAQELDGYDELQFLQNGSGWSSLSTRRARRLVHVVSKLLSCGVFQVLTAL